MATIKVNGTSYFISSSKITTPSIKINGQGYIPLFSGNKNGTVDYNRYRYTLGGLKVGNYRAAVSRTFINHAPTVRISSSASSVYNGTNVTLTAYASDPDGDALTYSWYRYDYARDRSSYIGGGYQITVSDSNKTWHYWCSVSDPYGATAYSDVTYVSYVAPPPANQYKCTVECWKEKYEHEVNANSPYASTGTSTYWAVRVTANRYPSNCEGICIFADIGNGTSWTYKSEQLEWYTRNPPSTVELTPYVSYYRTITYTETEQVWVGYRHGQSPWDDREYTVSRAIQDRQAAGTSKTVAVSFPDARGYENRITNTYEWN